MSVLSVAVRTLRCIYYQTIMNKQSTVCYDFETDCDEESIDANRSQKTKLSGGMFCKKNGKE